MSAATEETVGKTVAEGGGGGGHNNDAGDAESGSSSGGGGKRASLWLSLPFLAALLPGASPSTRQQAAMSINIALKVCVCILCVLSAVCRFPVRVDPSSVMI